MHCAPANYLRSLLELDRRLKCNLQPSPCHDLLDIIPENVSDNLLSIFSPSPLGTPPMFKYRSASHSLATLCIFSPAACFGCYFKNNFKVWAAF